MRARSGPDAPCPAVSQPCTLRLPLRSSSSTFSARPPSRCSPARSWGSRPAASGRRSNRRRPPASWASRMTRLAYPTTKVLWDVMLDACFPTTTPIPVLFHFSNHACHRHSNLQGHESQHIISGTTARGLAACGTGTPRGRAGRMQQMRASTGSIDILKAGGAPRSHSGELEEPPWKPKSGQNRHDNERALEDRCSGSYRRAFGWWEKGGARSWFLDERKSAATGAV